jgi:hypothetical protein
LLEIVSNTRDLLGGFAAVLGRIFAQAFLYIRAAKVLANLSNAFSDRRKASRKGRFLFFELCRRFLGGYLVGCPAVSFACS